MPWQLDTSSPMFQSLPPDQQAQYQKQYGGQSLDNVPIGLQQESAGLTQTQSQTQNIQAENPGIQAQSSKAQIEAQQTAALQSLSHDLKKNKMTLPDAISKYKGLGMNPDDVFTQYLAQSPWGFPKQSITELQNLGITPKTLGDIHTPNTIADRANVGSAIHELRHLNDLWNQTDTMAHLPFLGDKDASAKAYNSYKTLVSNHLSSLVPGASSSQGTGKDFANSLPNIGDPFGANGANGQFAQVEQGLLDQKRYKPEDVGVTPRQQTDSKSSSGGDLLHFLLPGAGAVVGGLAGAAVPIADLTGLPEAGGAAAGGAGGQYLADALTGKKPGADVAATGLLSAVPGGVFGKILGSGAKSGAAATLDNAPGAMRQLVQPNKAKLVIGTIRNNIVSTADKAGKTIDGGDLAQSIRTWANSAKLSNLPDANAIEDAASKAEELYKDKVFKPSDLKQIYDNIETGYTKLGQPRTATSSFIDRGINGVISKTLDDVAPGFKKTSELFAKTYQAEKSPLRAGVKNLAKYGLALGVPTAAADTIAHYVFGK